MSALAMLRELAAMTNPLDWDRIRGIALELDKMSCTKQEEDAVYGLKAANEQNFHRAVVAVRQAFGRRVVDEDGFPIIRR